MTDQENEPTTLAERIKEKRKEDTIIIMDEHEPERGRGRTDASAYLSRIWSDMNRDTGSVPSEATDAAVSASMETLGDGIRDAVKRRQWQAWRDAWNQRGSTDSMDSLEERTARTSFEQWWEKDA